jgi:hypothetical protein
MTETAETAAICWYRGGISDDEMDRQVICVLRQKPFNHSMLDFQDLGVGRLTTLQPVELHSQ